MKSNIISLKDEEGATIKKQNEILMEMWKEYRLHIPNSPVKRADFLRKNGRYIVKTYIESGRINEFLSLSPADASSPTFREYVTDWIETYKTT